MISSLASMFYAIPKMRSLLQRTTSLFWVYLGSYDFEMIKWVGFCRRNEGENTTCVDSVEDGRVRSSVKQISSF